MGVDADRPIQQVGILGGTFDPIHNGHLAIAEAARGCLGLDRVIFIPAGRPWLKARSLGRVTDAGHRLAMVRLAIADCPHFEASAMEVERPGLTYTVDTLAELRSREGRVTGPNGDVSHSGYGLGARAAPVARAPEAVRDVRRGRSVAPGYR